MHLMQSLQVFSEVIRLLMLNDLTGWLTTTKTENLCMIVTRIPRHVMVFLVDDPSLSMSGRRICLENPLIPMGTWIYFQP